MGNCFGKPTPDIEPTTSQQVQPSPPITVSPAQEIRKAESARPNAQPTKGDRVNKSESTTLDIAPPTEPHVSASNSSRPTAPEIRKVYSSRPTAQRIRKTDSCRPMAQEIRKVDSARPNALPTGDRFDISESNTVDVELSSSLTASHASASNSSRPIAQEIRKVDSARPPALPTKGDRFGESESTTLDIELSSPLTAPLVSASNSSRPTARIIKADSSRSLAQEIRKVDSARPPALPTKGDRFGKSESTTIELSSPLTEPHPSGSNSPRLTAPRIRKADSSRSTAQEIRKVDSALPPALPTKGDRFGTSEPTTLDIELTSPLTEARVSAYNSSRSMAHEIRKADSARPIARPTEGNRGKSGSTTLDIELSPPLMEAYVPASTLAASSQPTAQGIRKVNSSRPTAHGIRKVDSSANGIRQAASPRSMAQGIRKADSARPNAQPTMGNRFGKSGPTTLDIEATTSQQLPSPPMEAHVPASNQSSTRLVNGPLPGPIGRISPAQEIRKADSAPQYAQSTKGSANQLLSPLSVRTALSESSSGMPTSAVGTPRPPTDYPIRRLTSTVQQVLPEHFKFRILVVGKSGSGKSSLVKAVFKVTAAERALGEADINVEYCPEDNRYLIVHEWSGLESRAGDAQNIRDFISRRSDLSRSASERLHAVWICVPASDAIAGKLGEGTEEILSMRTTAVPVILVFTKLDVVVSRVLFDIPREGRDDPQQHERARAKALTLCEDCCRRLFHKDRRNVPAEIVSGKPRYVDLIEKLAVTTDKFILGSRGSSTGFGVQGERPRVNDVPLAWSAALRVSRGIVVQASIEVGRSGYWHRLWSNVDFADHTLKSCVNIIHVDLVEIWNLNDRARYLSGNEFKARMSHLVKDLAGSASAMPDPFGFPTGAEVEFADWVSHAYRGSKKNVRCIMGYIVDLTVVLDHVFSSASVDISPEDVRSAIESHVNSGNKTSIHDDIRRFVAEAFAVGFSVPQKDLILERIIDLIQQFCVPPAGIADSHFTRSSSHAERRRGR